MRLPEYLSHPDLGPGSHGAAVVAVGAPQAGGRDRSRRRGRGPVPTRIALDASSSPAAPPRRHHRSRLQRPHHGIREPYQLCPRGSASVRSGSRFSVGDRRNFADHRGRCKHAPLTWTPRTPRARRPSWTPAAASPPRSAWRVTPPRRCGCVRRPARTPKATIVNGRTAGSTRRLPTSSSAGATVPCLRVRCACGSHRHPAHRWLAGGDQAVAASAGCNVPSSNGGNASAAAECQAIEMRAMQPPTARAVPPQRIASADLLTSSLTETGYSG
jgi:hypothetical protein